MSVFVDDNAGLEAAVTVGSRSGPGVHAHAAGLAIGRSSKVGVVGTRAVLGVQDNEVVATAALVVVVELKVSCLLGETERVEKVVEGVGGVEELSNGGVDVS